MQRIAILSSLAYDIFDFEDIYTEGITKDHTGRYGICCETWQNYQPTGNQPHSADGTCYANGSTVYARSEQPSLQS